MKSITLLLLAATSVFPLATFAHEGHGHDNPWSPGHFLANPEHSIPLALAIALVTALVVRRYLAAKKARK